MVLSEEAFEKSNDFGDWLLRNVVQTQIVDINDGSYMLGI